MLGKFWVVVAATASLWCGAPGAALAACISISSASDLNRIRSNMAGDYCLTGDLELSGTFAPIGSLANAFTGTFDGRGHVIRGLTIRSAGDAAGLFAWVHGGQVSNLTLAAVSVNSTRDNALVGAVAGFLTGDGEINKVHVTGALECSGDGCRIGGIVGQMGDATLRNSSSTAAVRGGHGGAAGGAAGQIGGNAVRSFATGRVLCGTYCAAGGFTGDQTSGAIIQCFAAGRVRQGRGGIAGGLVGREGGRIFQGYSTGGVNVVVSTAGSLSGSSGHTREAFAIGRVRGGAGSTLGGLHAFLGSSAADTIASYWDTNTTRQSFSPAGVPRTTVQLRAGLPAGFGNSWGITKSYSYPFLDVPGLDFSATLATLVKANEIFTFLPISQREPMEYGGRGKNAEAASLAAVYTMIARAIGATKLDARLEDAPIDRFFWDDVRRRANWRGPVTGYANLLELTRLPEAAAINNSNILGPLKRGEPVIIRGRIGQEGTDPHWMLATLFRTNGANTATHLVANDPWTGKQVLIDVATRRVTSPADFPLAGFKVDAYQRVTLN